MSYKRPCLGSLKDFWVEFAFINFRFCSLHLRTFARKNELSCCIVIICFLSIVNHH